MKIAYRHLQILEILKEQQQISIQELSRMLNVSPITIRRDIIILEQRTLLQRLHGKVITIEASNFNESSIMHRGTVNVRSKKAIAQKAHLLIKEDMTLFLDNSTTVLQMIPFLKKFRSIRVITNSIAVTRELERMGNVQLIVLGGELNRHYGLFFSPYFKKLLNKYYFNIAFLGTTGLSKLGTMELDTYTADFKNQVTKQTDQTVVLCDYHKVQKNNGILSIPYKNISLIITNSNADILKNIALDNKIQYAD